MFCCPRAFPRPWFAFIFFLVAAFYLLCPSQAACHLSGESPPHPPPTSAPQAATRRQSTPQPTEQFRLSKKRYEKAVAYSRAGYILYFVYVSWGVLVLYLLLQLRVVACLRDFAQTQTNKGIVQALIFVPALFLLLAVLHLPLRIYGHSLSVHYGESVQRWGSWFWDWTKGQLLSVAVGYLVVVILFAVMRWKPRSWWLYFWFAAVPLALFLFFISPWFIDPLFQTFQPLQQSHPALVASIGKLSQRAGIPIPPERMFLMQASKKTKAVNAYVTGLGASKRVVIWDTSIQKMAPDELLFMVGHEMGHYVLGHVIAGFSFFLGGLLVALFAAYQALRWLLNRSGNRWGIQGPTDWAALGVLLLILNVLSFLAMPIANGISRTKEHAADVYGLEVIHGVVPNAQEVAAHEFQVLGDIDLADPNPPPFIVFWLYSHPPLAERLAFAHNYDPWSRGEPPKYVK
jgi:STE24 endopeptidase